MGWFTITLLAALASQNLLAGQYQGWGEYGGGPEQIRYSALDQVNRRNVHKLTVAWTFDTHDAFTWSEMQCNPIIVDHVLYATTPKLRIIALNAANGNLLWSFDPFDGQVRRIRNRGVTFWRQGPDRRILFVAGHFLYALNAADGKPVKAFGNGGRVDLRQNLGRDPESITITATSPGIIYKNLFILGGMMAEDLPAPPGDIRAYDAATGELRWSFHTIPHPGEFGYETWPKETWRHTGAANSWAGMSVDQKRGIVFAPTGSAAYDFYGPDRIGDNLFANSLLALNAETGERLWHFQIVRHDLWDRDLPAPPSLVRVKREGKLTDAVAQITKSGHVFVFERETGRPVFPITYREFPASEVDGEVAAPAQPLPLKPPPFARQLLTEAILTRRTPAAHQAVLETFRTLRSIGQFAPPNFQKTVIFPGFDGGGEWGGAAFDPDTRLLYVNANDVPYTLRLVPRLQPSVSATGRDLYLANCAACHRADLLGTPPQFPSLAEVGRQRTPAQIAQITRTGSGRMPGFPSLGEERIQAIAQFLNGNNVTVRVRANTQPPVRLKYRADGYNKFLDPDGYPAVEPPWGTLSAIDLDKGEIAWQIPLGEIPELAAQGITNTGSENYGGPAVTAGGLVFIGATIRDKKFRAFDKLNGKLLWETTLPAPANSTPAVYEVDGREFIVTAAGGGKWKDLSGSTYVAFALPKRHADFSRRRGERGGR